MKKNSKNVIVEIIDVSKHFKEVSVLEHVNLKLESGNIYGFIGPNGSGKTVLLKMICGFYTPSSGKILINSKNIVEEKSYPENTGALIEKPTFIPDLTGKENLMLLAKIQNKVTEKDIEKAFNMAKEITAKDDALICCGSLYLIGALYKIAYKNWYIAGDYKWLTLKKKLKNTNQYLK